MLGRGEGSAACGRQNAIEQFGLRVGSTITAHEICDLGIGLIVAQLILQRALYVRNTHSFKLSWDCCLLEPMDIVTLTDPGLGLARTPARILSIEEGSDGILAMTAEEFPGNVSALGTYTQPATTTATSINRNVAPAPVNAPVILEAPSPLTGGVPQLWAVASGGGRRRRRRSDLGQLQCLPLERRDDLQPNRHHRRGRLPGRHHCRARGADRRAFFCVLDYVSIAGALGEARLSMPVTYYVAMPFIRNEEGELVPGEAQDRHSASAAESLARRMSETAAGAVAFSRTGEPATGEFENAVVLRSFGEVPSMEDLLREG